MRELASISVDAENPTYKCHERIGDISLYKHECSSPTVLNF